MERERAREHTQNGEDRIMKIQELVYNRPNLIRSQVGSVSTFGCMLQFHIFLFSPSDLCVYSVQCRQKVKLSNASVHSSIIAEHEREKESAIIMYVFSLMLAYVSGYIYLCAYVCSCICMCSPRGTYLFHSMCRWGVWVSCVLVSRRPWMLSRLQLGTAMVHLQPCGKQQEQATYKLNGHTLKTSSVTLASSSMSRRAMKQAINTCIVLGRQSEQEVQGIFRFI